MNFVREFNWLCWLVTSVNNLAGNFNASTTQPAGTAGVNIQASNVSLNSASSNYAHVVASAEL